MDRQKVKSGLGLMFWGNIVALFAVIPILGVIAALVGGIMHFGLQLPELCLGSSPVEMDYGEQRYQFSMALQHWVQPTTFAQQQRNV